MIDDADDKSKCRSCLQFVLTYFELPLDPSFALLAVVDLAGVVVAHDVDEPPRKSGMLPSKMDELIDRRINREFVNRRSSKTKINLELQKHI